MKKLHCTALLAAALALPAIAQTAPAEHAAHHPASAAAGAVDMTNGEVRKVDKAQAKLTLRHAEIKSLDMPPMTMVFAVKDKSMLDKLQVGDKVRFKAENDNGKFTVTAIEAAR